MSARRQFVQWDQIDPAEITFTLGVDRSNKAVITMLSSELPACRASCGGPDCHVLLGQETDLVNPSGPTMNSYGAGVVVVGTRLSGIRFY